MTDPNRPPGRETETEDQRRPTHEGEPPRPATEPGGSEGSSNRATRPPTPPPEHPTRHDEGTPATGED